MTAWQWGSLASAPLVYVALLATGHWLKRRWGVRLGIIYHLFAAATALFAPMPWIPAPDSVLRAFATAVTLLATLVILSVAQRVLWEGYYAEKHQAPVPKFVGEVLNLVIFVIVVLIVLNGFYSIEIPHLLAGSGILAVILGLALQDTLGNILAGFALHFEKPYRVGDWLVVDQRHAQVVEVNWRATRLRTNDDVYLDIPNSQLAKASIINLSYPTTVHAMRLRVGLEYATPPNDAKDALLQATAAAPGVLKEPSPKVFVVEFGDSAVIYEIKYWLNDHSRFNDITDAVRTNIWYELNRRQFNIPFPIRTIQMREPGALGDTEDTKLVTRKTLRDRSLFASFNDTELDELMSMARRGRYGRGETIIAQGNAGDSMFVLLDGTADVLVASNGHHARVAGLGAGDCFGEMSLLNGEPRSATIVARSDCDVMEITKRGMAEILEHNPDLLTRLSEILAKRRIENEGVLAKMASARAAETEKQYTATFLTRLKSFFDL
jgi:small-conductance mechanosensitive channel/CRP-like cAMP-binding protein